MHCNCPTKSSGSEADCILIVNDVLTGPGVHECLRALHESEAQRIHHTDLTTVISDAAVEFDENGIQTVISRAGGRKFVRNEGVSTPWRIPLVSMASLADAA